MNAVRSAAILFALFPLTLAPAYAQDAAADGQRLFQTRCGSCHSVEAGQNRIGPNLAGVVGRTAGTVEGGRYSPALKSSNIVWNDETLNTFLDNPRQVVPGTTMTVSLRDAAQRGAVISYLRSLAQ